MYTNTSHAPGSVVGAAAYYDASSGSEHFIWNGVDFFQTSGPDPKTAFGSPSGLLTSDANASMYSTDTIPGQSFARATIAAQSFQYDPNGYLFKTQGLGALPISINSPSTHWKKQYNSNTSTSFWYN